MQVYHRPASAGIEVPPAMTARHASALVTTLVRGENLIHDGYSIDAGEREGLFTVTGQPTFKKSGEQVNHGPYDVDTVADTCTCEAFANLGSCKHLKCCKKLESGQVPQMREALESTLWALEGVKTPGKYRATDTSLLYVYRSEGLALNDCKAHRQQLGDMKPAPVTLSAILETGKYSGLRLVMRGGMETIWFSAADGPAQVREPAPNTQQFGRSNPWALPVGAPLPYIPSDAEIAESRRRQARMAIDEDTPSLADRCRQNARKDFD